MNKQIKTNFTGQCNSMMFCAKKMQSKKTVTSVSVTSVNVLVSNWKTMSSINQTSRHNSIQEFVQQDSSKDLDEQGGINKLEFRYISIP